MEHKIQQDKSINFRFSFIDYLVGEAVTHSSASRSHTLRQLRSNISRDLENLLNAKKRFISLSENLSGLRNSIINYGLDDFMSDEVDSISFFDQLCPKIEEVINLFEPRLTHVRVSCEKQLNNDLFNRSVKFKIQATLKLEPVDEAISFEFMLKSENEVASFNYVNDQN